MTSTGPALGVTCPMYGGRQVRNPADVLVVTTTPSSNHQAYRLGTIAVQASTNSVWMLTNLASGVATWTLLATGSGSVESVLGTANQVTVTTVGTTATVSLPSAITTPGSLTTTTTLASGTTLAAGTSFSAGTTITATSGAITATNGNLVLGTAGNKILSTSVATTTTAGANSFGSVTLASGTATVATTAVTANSLIYIWRQSIGSTGAGALGFLTVGTISAGVSFIVRAALIGTATSTATTDVSIVGWMIVN